MRFGPNQIPVPFTEQEKDWPNVSADGDVGNPLAEVSKIDRNQAKVRIYNGAAVGFSDFWVTASVWGQLTLPPTLSALSVSYQKGGASTLYTEIGVNSTTGSFSVGMSVGGTAQASSYCVPKLLHTIVDNSRDNFEFRHDWFYLKLTTKAAILAALTTKIGSTVLALPNFKVEQLNFTTTAEKNNGSAHAQFQGSSAHSASGNSASASDGFATSVDLSPSIDQYDFPATLHGSFSLTGSDSSSHTGTVALAVSGTVSGGTANSITVAASGTVTPTSVSATSPTDIPHSGLYMYRCEVQPGPDLGNWFIHTVIVDFATV